MLVACRSPSLPAEILVQVVKHGGPALEARLVVPMAHGNPGDQPIDARCLGTIELRVLQVDVVHDLRNRHEGTIVETEARHEDLEGAEVAFMRELRLKHVKAEFLRVRLVALGRHELEAGVGVDEPANKPGTRDSVDVDALPRHPDPAPEGFHTAVPLFLPLLCARRSKPRLEAAHASFGCLTTWSSKEIDATDLSEATSEFSDFSLDLGSTVFGDCAAGKLGFELPGRIGNLSVVRISRSVEGSLHLLVAQAFDETRLAERRFAALLDDLPKHPLEVLTGLIGIWQRVDRVLDGHSAERLQAPPDLDAQVSRLRRNLMHQEKP